MMPGVHPAASHCALILSSSVVSFTHVGQPQVSDALTRWVHCTMLRAALHMRASQIAFA